MSFIRVIRVEFGAAERPGLRCARLAAPTTLRSALVALDLERGEGGRKGSKRTQCDVCAMILDSTDIHDAFRLSMRLEGRRGDSSGAAGE